MAWWGKQGSPTLPDAGETLAKPPEEAKQNTSENPGLEALVESVLVKAPPEKAVPQTEAQPAPSAREWTEEQMADAAREYAAANPDPKDNTPPRKKYQGGRKRKNEFHMCLTDAELTALNRRIASTGLGRGEFVRQAALHSRIVIKEPSLLFTKVLDELELIRAELGRQGGLLKMVIKPNEGQRQLSPGEWDELIDAVRQMDQLKKRIMEAAEKFNGDHNPSDQ